MTWVDLSSAFSYGSKLTSTQMQNLRDNITALANGDSGAPELQTAAYADDSVTNAKLGPLAIDTAEIANSAVTTAKIAAANVNTTRLKTGSGNTSGSLSAGSSVNIQMQDYCFFPLIWVSTNLDDVYVHPYYNATDPVDTTGRFRLHNSHGSSSRDYSARYRYVTASDRPFIYAVRNAFGKIIAVWACEDPPIGYWGLNEKPHDFKPPIQQFENNKLIIPDDEIVIFDYDINEYKTIIERAQKDKKLLHEMLSDEYELMSGNKIFTRRNLSQI